MNKKTQSTFTVKVLFTLLFTTSILSFGQKNNEVDSLISIGDSLLSNYPDSSLIYYNRANLLSNKNAKTKSLGKIGTAFYYLNMTDSSVYYWEKSVKEALSTKNLYQAGLMYNNMGLTYLYTERPSISLLNFEEALNCFKQIQDSLGMFDCYNNFGTYYLNKDAFEKSLTYYDTALFIAKQLKDTLSISTVYINRSVVYSSKGDMKNTLKENLIAANYLEKIKNYHNLIIIYGNLGALYLDINKIAKAKEFLLLATNFMDTVYLEPYYKPIIYLNTGIVYMKYKEYEIAKEYYSSALIYAKKMNDYKAEISVYLNLSNLYSETNDYNKALYISKKALKISKQINSKKLIASTSKNIGANYNLLRQYTKAIKYLENSYSISVETNNLTYILDILYELKIAYKGIGDYKQAFLTDEKILMYRDSLSSIEIQKQLVELTTLYETEKKEQQIKIQQVEIEKGKVQNAKEKAEKEHQITQRNLFITTSGLMLLLALFVYRSYKLKQKANTLLTQQKHEITEKNEELNQQNEEITAQRDEIEKQKEIVEDIHYEISESINYATRLQQSILPEEKILSKYLSEHFVLFKPKDKVSGDFYWWAHVENHTVITAADCTGHGVPGAFMSMLGASFLREIVQKEYVTHTGVILRKLRKEIIKSLKQKDEIGGQKDGMDMAIISINHETNIVQFSGANNPLYIIKNEELKINDESSNAVKLYDSSNFWFYEIRPNKMPIAIYEKMDNFTTHEIQLEKDDQLYMFSDGFADQFGGTKGKKFMYKPFKKLLLENADKPMTEQKEILNSAFENWKGDMEQIDDVVVLGIKI